MNLITYRASMHVRLGKPDEHAYNMFISFMEQCKRLGLWEHYYDWRGIHDAFSRLTRGYVNALDVSSNSA